MSCCGKKLATKVNHIVTGWTSLATTQPTSEAKRRLTICRNCSSNRWGKLRMWCKECKCFIPAKVRVLTEECKLGNW